MSATVNIGYENYIAIDKIFLIMRPDIANYNKIVGKAEKQKRFFNTCRNKRAYSYILTNDKLVFASPHEPETIVRRIAGVKG